MNCTEDEDEREDFEMDIGPAGDEEDEVDNEIDITNERVVTQAISRLPFIADVELLGCSREGAGDQIPNS